MHICTYVQVFIWEKRRTTPLFQAVHMPAEYISPVIQILDAVDYIKYRASQ